MNRTARNVIVLASSDELAAAAADRFIDSARRAVAARGRFAVALAGGSTPEKMYALLAAPPRAAQVDWAHTQVFFGDERFVPHDDARSNCLMARRTLLDHVPLAREQVHAIRVDTPSPSDSARAYAATLSQALAAPPDGPPPRLDLILLGLGDDGHTASLFPHAAALNERTAWVTSSPHGVLPPPVDRVTLTFPVLCAAREVLFLVAGANKAAALADIVDRGARIEDRPAAGVALAGGMLAWLVDEAAASQLERRT